jgi:hypothetical protein
MKRLNLRANLSIRPTGGGGSSFEVPLKDDGTGPRARGALLPTANGARFELEGESGTSVKAEFSKAGDGRLSVLLSSHGAQVSLSFDRARVRSELQQAKTQGKGVPADLAPPDNYLAFTKQAASVPAVAALARSFAQSGAAEAKEQPQPSAATTSLATEERQLAATAVLLAPQMFVPAATAGTKESLLPISFGDEECDEIADLYDEVCGGGILCLIGAIYYDALCTLVSAL